MSKTIQRNVLLHREVYFLDKIFPTFELQNLKPMKLLVFIVLSLSLIACHSNGVSTKSKEEELVELLDSIGGLDKEKLAKDVSFFADSVLNSQIDLNITLSDKAFALIKKIATKEQISLADAKQIFPDLIDNELLYLGVPLRFFSFDDDPTKFNQYAIAVGSHGLSFDSDIYFFQGKNIIAKQHVLHKHGLKFEHFKDENDRTVVYYSVNFMSDTEIWWFQYNFYRYDNGKLIPVLTEQNDSYLGSDWGSMRSFWLTADVVRADSLNFVSANPLKIEFRYKSLPFMNEKSTIVTYNIDAQTVKYVADFSNSDFDKYKLLSFCLMDNDLLFVSAYHAKLKEYLNGNDPIMRKTVFNFLEDLRKRLNKISLEKMKQKDENKKFS